MRRYYPRIRSRHPSHNPLRMGLKKMPFRSVVRLGSTTEEPEVNGREVNSIEAVKTSSNKLIMKQKFNDAGVDTADWRVIRENAWHIYMYNETPGYFEYDGALSEGIEYPIVAKHIFGSRGTGNTLLNNQQELDAWLVGKDLTKYIFEKFYSYSREYRLHVTSEGCFYTCRKMLKSDTPEDKRWFRNDSNSVWILEDNPKFDKPVNWSEIVEHSINAIKAVGLDIGAVDVKVQSAKNQDGELRENCKFIILETNSAPSFGDITLVKYKEEIPKILERKYL